MSTEDVNVMTQDDLDALWAKLKGWFVKGLSSATDGAAVAFDGTSGKLIKPLGYTPFNNANFTKANIKSTLGIYDWALAASKPSYAFSEITGTVTNAQLAGSIANSKLASAGKFTIGSTDIELGTTYTAANFRGYLGLGGAATYGATSSVTDGGTSLVTSGGVYSYVNALLTAAMKIEGETTTAISDGSTTNPVVIGGQSVSAYKGMVVFYGSKEFVWVGTAWKELGDESSFALKTTTVSGTGYLTGGGALSSNQTIDIASSVKTNIDNGATAYGWGNHASAGYALASNLGTASTHAHGDYVTGMSWDSTNNKLAWSKGGTAQTAITIGYASSAGSVAWGNVSGRPTNVSAFTNDSGYITSSASITGNAGSATKLQTARSINGTSFNGTADITTANWGTARNISIADSDSTNTGTAVSVNGSAAVTLKLPATIKATLSGNATSATKATNDSDGNAINTTYLKLSGGTMTGHLTMGSGSRVIFNDAMVQYKLSALSGTEMLFGPYAALNYELAYYNGSSWGKVWHANNDGSGSGLDADKLDGYHASELYVRGEHRYGLENYIYDVVAGRQTTRVDDDTITTTGTASDTYFYIKTSEQLVPDEVYTFGFYVEGYTGTGTWVFRCSNSQYCATVSINKNGWVWGTGTAIPSGGTATSQLLIDDAGSGNARALTFSKFIMVKGYALPAYVKAMRKQTIGYASALATARTIWGQSFDGSANISGELTNVGDISFSATGKNIGGLLYFDTTNARLGVGVSSPLYKLHVGGDIVANGGMAARGIVTLDTSGAGISGAVTQINVGSTSYTPSDGIVSLPAYPTTLPASDVSAWAKASTRPVYPTSLESVTSGTSVVTLNFGGKYMLSTGDSTCTFSVASLPTASTSQAGIVQLSSAVDSTSATLAATPAAVKSAYDLASGMQPKQLDAGASSTAGTASLTLSAFGTSTYALVTYPSNSAVTAITIAQSSASLVAGSGRVPHYLVLRNEKSSAITVTFTKYNNSNYYLAAPCKTFTLPANSTVEISHVHVIVGSIRQTFVTIGDILGNIT